MVFLKMCMFERLTYGKFQATTILCAPFCTFIRQTRHNQCGNNEVLNYWGKLYMSSSQFKKGLSKFSAMRTTQRMGIDFESWEPLLWVVGVVHKLSFIHSSLTLCFQFTLIFFQVRKQYILDLDFSLPSMFRHHYAWIEINHRVQGLSLGSNHILTVCNQRESQHRVVISN